MQIKIMLTEIFGKFGCNVKVNAEPVLWMPNVPS
jgi:hypothetical protein